MNGNECKEKGTKGTNEKKVERGGRKKWRKKEESERERKKRVRERKRVRKKERKQTFLRWVIAFSGRSFQYIV